MTRWKRHPRDKGRRPGWGIAAHDQLQRGGGFGIVDLDQEAGWRDRARLGGPMPAREQSLHGPAPAQKPAGARDPALGAGGAAAGKHPDTSGGFELGPFLEFDLGSGRSLVNAVLEPPAVSIVARLVEIAGPIAGGRGALHAMLTPIEQRAVRDPRRIEPLVSRRRHRLPVTAPVVMVELKHR
jgi:hypothetical protein